MVWLTPITSLLALAASLSLSEAQEFDVWGAPITYPDLGTVWKVGQEHHVKWNTDDIPDDASPKADIKLAHDGEINSKHPLAKNIDYKAGEVQITVPDVDAGYYQVVLFSDSGDFDTSPVFKIDAA